MKIKQRNDSGAALIIVLAFVVLLTGLVVAYFSRAVTDRQVAQGSFNQTKTDQFAMSATDLIMTDLKQEIANGSTLLPVGGITIYTPTSNANMVPMRSGTPDPTLIPSPTPIPNLVRRSVRTDAMPLPGVKSRASAVNSTTDVSLNGRNVSLARWNKHYLIPRDDTLYGGGNANKVGTDPATSFLAPDWVFVTSSGPAVLTTPNSATIGRYAYAIYDEGGLVDMNVAGFPSNTTTVQSGRKGSVAFADLTITSTINLPQFRIDDIVGWRNYATAKPAGDFSNNFTFDTTAALNYFNFIALNTTGFMKTSGNVWNSRTDQAFLSRQQLIDLRSSLGPGPGFTQDALQYLGTFSRELNSPSYAPTIPSATNPNLVLTRVTSSFTRFDGTIAAVDEPLIQTRFPLSRLAWITYKGPSGDLYGKAPADPIITQLLANNVPLQTIQAGTAANVTACFGLAFGTKPSDVGDASKAWSYSHGSSSALKTLSAVVSAKREADFFELLNAAILSGSLGDNTGGGVTGPKNIGGTDVFPDVHMSSTMQHILSIGAAIIDQTDGDSIPTRIQFTGSNGNTWTAYGIESLPYITEMYPIAGRSPNDATNKTWASYLIFQLWNPHQNMPSTPSVRLRIDGSIGTFRGGNGEIWDSTKTPTTTNQSVTITSSNLFAEPMPLTSANSGGTGSSQGVFSVLAAPTPSPNPLPAGSIVGFRLTDFPASTPPPGTVGNSHLMMQIGASTKQGNKTTTNPFNATMEVDTGGGVWIPYNRFVGIDDSATWVYDAPLDVRDSLTRTTTVPAFFATTWTESPHPSFMKADPRSTRFGIFQMDTNPTTGSKITLPLWPSASLSVPNGYGGSVATVYPGPVEHAPLRFGSLLPYFPATLCINNAASTATRTSYADNDGVIRAADATYPDPANNTTGSSTPFYVTNLAYHPIILNRPFRSVGELGYAFRDLPWKSLDLFTQNSSDAGLLDVFSAYDQPAMIAGRINLNTKQSAGLQAVLAGAIWDEITSSIMDNTNGDQGAPTIASRTVSAASITPFQNTAALITTAALPTTLLPTPTPSRQDNQSVKARREVVPRALASVSQTRTWNLMIDVIAQSGRYAPGETSLAKFFVNGEQRYWVHVAIDRFTGEVIDRQVEVVKE